MVKPQKKGQSFLALPAKIHAVFLAANHWKSCLHSRSNVLYLTARCASRYGICASCLYNSMDSRTLLCGKSGGAAGTGDCLDLAARVFNN
jgi:hypothetical protein